MGKGEEEGETERRALTIGIHERSLPGGLACERTLCPSLSSPCFPSLQPSPPSLSLLPFAQAALPSHIFRGGSTVTGTPYIRPSGNARAGHVNRIPSESTEEENARRARKSSRGEL